MPVSLRLRPMTVKEAKRLNGEIHRRLKKVQGAMWAVSVRAANDVVGVALVGSPARVWNEDTLAVLRVAVLEDNRNACSMLYGACSRAARAMGADNLVTYTHGDEHGSSLKAANWIRQGITEGGEWDREDRQRELAVDPLPKWRWLAPWSERLRSTGGRVDPSSTTSDDTTRDQRRPSMSVVKAAGALERRGYRTGGLPGLQKFAMSHGDVPKGGMSTNGGCRHGQCDRGSPICETFTALCEALVEAEAAALQDILLRAK
jgi:hypothetical protein